MKDILSEIVAHKRLELTAQKQAQPFDVLRREAESTPCSTRSMRRALTESASGIIAEFKRRSPSKGWIHQGADACTIPPAYARTGAAALSILTDETFFGGSLADLTAARSLTEAPILRKDFIIDPYQLWQARRAGADAVLLIAACLTPDACHTLAAQAHMMGLEVLLEVHSKEELEYVQPGIDMVGVNNRHLGSFITDVQTSFQLAEALQERVALQGGNRPPVLVSESGLKQASTLCALREAGFRGFLIGETFMRSASPAEALRRLIEEMNPPIPTAL